MADGGVEGVGRECIVTFCGVGAQLGFFVFQLGQRFLDEVALELVSRTMGSLVVARAVPVRRGESGSGK